MMKKDKSKIEERVISKIESGEIKMKSRKYFVFKAFVFFFSLLLLSLFLLYIGSLIVFVLRANDIFLFQGMGLKGWRAIFLSFPWYLVLLSFFLIVLLQIFGNKFRLVYRRPLFYSFIAIILFVILGSVLIERCSFHQTLYNRARQGEFSLGSGMYRHLGDIDLEHKYTGTVLDIKELQVIIKQKNNEIFIVNITRDTRGKRFFQDIVVGSEIVVIGKVEGNTIDANAIRKINDQVMLNER